MLWNVDQVVRGIAACMDDPAMTEFDKDYLLPFINLHWQDLSNELSMLGLTYQEFRVEVPYAAGSTNLDDAMQDSGPLGSLMLPKRVEWKLAGAPDTTYVEARNVDELDDYDSGLVGIPEVWWAGGSIQTPASSVDLTLRVTFLAMSTNLVDPNDSMVRGASNVISYKVAGFIYSIRGNDPLAAKMEQRGDDAQDTFERMAVMRDQATLRRCPPMHPRITRRFLGAAIT